MWLLRLMLLVPLTASAVTVKDDLGRDIHLEQPARRIVSLSPHTTELLYAAGAGSHLVGVSHYSDYPPAAQKITTIGDTNAIDIEKILMLKPDLIVAWHSGNTPSQLTRLRTLGLPVFESQPTDYAMIASSLERLATLSGTPATGQQAAAHFRMHWQILEQHYRNRPSINVFYQIWNRPLMTLNGKHMISAVLRTCGGRNIFSDLPQLTPTVSMESVIAANPDVILIPDDANNTPLNEWRRFSTMKAVAANNLFTIHADWLNRPGPRILNAVAEVCDTLDTARNRLSP